MAEALGLCSPEMEKQLRLRFDRVLERIALAAEKAERPRGEIGLTAVSKYHPASAVAALASYWQEKDRESGGKIGLPRFGENYVREALEKKAEVARLLENSAPVRLEWHFTGHLQSNKAGQVLGQFALLHTLDSEHLAHILHKRWEKEAALIPANKDPFPVQAVLLQINIGEEERKYGIDRASGLALARYVSALPGFDLRGLMCLPPQAGEPEAVRPFFAALRRLRDEIEQALGLALPCLSMGMSGDLEAAVAEGSTLLRVGTDIFGPRI